VGWRATTDVAGGFRRTVAWLRDHPGVRAAYERRSSFAQGKST